MTPAWRAWLLLATAALAGCSIEARSAGFACEGPTDCQDGRVCESGWCVLPGGGGPDDDGGGGTVSDGGDAAGQADAALVECSEAFCDFCDQGTCVFLCQSGGSCPGTVECPAGMPCRVVCDGVGACGGGVDCTAATACVIDCTKNGACAGSIECGEGACDVACTARDTCLSGVDCSDSCACATNCSGAGACGDGPECPFDQCVATDGDCTTGTSCDVCGG